MTNDTTAMNGQDYIRRTDPTPSTRRLSLVCAGSLTLFGILALISGQLGLTAFTKMGGGYVATAPDTSVSFLFLGAAMLVSLVHPERRWSHLCTLFCSLGVILLSVLPLAEAITGLPFNIASMLSASNGDQERWKPGMSPLTGVVFLAAALSIIILSNSKPEQRVARNLASWLGILVGITGVTVLLGYAYASPLLYGGSVKPVALPTSIFVTVLGTGLVAIGGRDVLPYALFVGPSVRARLMRAFFPPVVAIVLLAGYLETGLMSSLFGNQAIGSSMVTILSAILFTILITRLAHNIGGDIDDNFSERRRAEDELKRANRALRTLSKCNEVLVHARSEEVLLTEICKAIVEYGGYRLAWVGYAERDSGKTVRPVGYAGFEEGYLEQASITWSDTERGRGPTGTAIRTGLPATCRNVHTDPAFAPWRDDALQRGYSSSLVLPLKNGDGVFGALNIYAREPDAFDDEEVRLLTETTNDLAYGILALRDRLERHRAEEEVQRAATYNRSLIEASLDPLVTIDANGKILDVNEATQNVTGCSRSELIGTDFSNYFTEPGKARAGYELVFRQGFVRDYELEVRHRDGRVTSVLYNASVYRDETGNVVGVFAAARDITERKRAEEAVRQYRDHLEDLVKERTTELEFANKELEAFAYSVSHDLRAPLRGIDGFSQALIEEYDQILDDKGQEYLHRVRAAAMRMSDLIDDMLELSRVGRSEMRVQPVDLSVLVEGIAAELQRTDPERHVQMTIERGIVASGDQRLLKIVLENLIGNAWKFTGKTAHASIAFGKTDTGDTSAFFVRDNGVGFDMQYADKLFGAFQRLHSTSEFPGTGIGLATVQRIVHRHGGRVWAKSAVNQGATFFFTLSYGANHERQNHSPR